MTKKIQLGIYIQEIKGKALIPRFSGIIDVDIGDKVALTKYNYEKRAVKELYEIKNQNGKGV